jgi:hypothetical protein
VWTSLLIYIFTFRRAPQPSNTVVFQLHQVRKRLFSLESEESRAQFLKCFNGEGAPEQKDPLTRGCPLYIAGVNGIVVEHQHALVF